MVVYAQTGTGENPIVTVVIAARDAESTLAQALGSVCAQTFADWEAIVVDDGSTDGTACVAQQFADRDDRIRLLRQRGAGVGAARNMGIAHARGTWLQFLDADDLLLPEALERLLATAGEEGVADVVYCGWARVDEAANRRIDETQARHSGDLFEHFARSCVFACHAAIVRRTAVQRVGGFDETPRLCEDWDLWQRIARTGAGFQALPATLVLYRTTRDSRSMQPRQIAAESLAIIDLGHAPDPRVEFPAARHSGGTNTRGRARARVAMAVFWAGVAIGRGERPDWFTEVHGPLEALLDPVLIVDCLHGGIPVGECAPRSDWLDLWPRHERVVLDFLRELGHLSHTPAFAERARRLFELRVARAGTVDRPTFLGRTVVVPVELTAPLEDVAVDADVLSCALSYAGELVGWIELPVCDGHVTARVIADAAAAAHAWTILSRLYVAVDSDYDVSRHDDSGWLHFLRDVWRLPGAEMSVFYPADGCVPEPELEPMQLVTVEVSADISPFVSVGPKGRLPVTVGGTTVGVLDLKPNSVFTADGLRAEVTAALGFELCCSAVREGVIGRPVRDGSTIRERLADVAARVSCEKPSGARGPQRAGLVLARRSPTAFGTSACRRALLPAAASDALLDMAAACREPVLGVGPVRDPSPVVYAPEVIAGSREGDGDAVPEIYDPDEGQVAPVRTLPILMYHRVAESVAEPLAPYAVTPAAFAEQLSWLRDQAFVSIDLDDWLPVAQSRTPLHRPGIVITFDDGYQDFADTAWPLLCEYGFGATVFLVTDLVGKTNRWDERLGGPVPLLDWRGIRALEEEGVRFGAHSTTHPPLTGIANNAVVGQAARSRATLTRMLRRPVAGFAYPYGDFDPAVAHLVGACGYVFGLTVECRRASFHDSLLTLPRIGILGDDGIADFARKLTET